MDPASAFGFAVNILTVVDFCFKVLLAASEIRTTGTTVTAADRLSIVKDLESCCRKLGDNTSIARDDSALFGLASEARLIAADIERSLLQRQVGHTPLGSMRDAFLQIWGESRMRDKMSRLETIRNELQFRIIVSMRDGIQCSSFKNCIALDVSDRNDDIENAHGSTFDWILPSQTFLGQQNCNFSDWIESNSGLYLLSGRAGTGKSTLMKYIAGHPQITEAFQRWAGCHELVMATYWFWDRRADGLQNSLQGLLQGLLYEIIKRMPAYGSLLFPDHHSVTRPGWQRDFPTLHELKRAFKRLASAQPSPAYIAIFINGLDECEAEFQDRVKIAELLTQAAVSTHIKVVVSSRPETAFEATLQGCNRLHLHNITQQDIQKYATDMLSSHPRVPYLKTQHHGQEAFYDLIQAIASKSEGVFLWLRLVVQSLMEHLNDCNTIQELHQVVDVFTEGLQSLYLDMMQRIRTDHRSRGYQLLELARRNIALSDTLTPWYYATADKTLPEPPSHCSDPNQAYASITYAGASTTPWKEMLTTLRDLRIVCIRGAQQLADIVTSMVVSGADPNAEASFEERSARGSASRSITRRPLQLIQHAFIDKLETPQTALYEGLVYHDDLLKEFRPCTISRWGTYVGNFVPFESLSPDWTVSEYPWINHFGPLQLPDPDATGLGTTEMDRIKDMGRKLMDLLRSKGAVADVPAVTAQQRRRHLAYYRPWLARRFGPYIATNMEFVPSSQDLPAEIRLTIWELAIAPMSSTPRACAVHFVSLNKHENPESSSKHDATSPLEDRLPGYLSHESAFFDFGLWTASIESRQVISKHVLKHAPRKELGKYARLGRMHINGEDIVFDVFNDIITCFRVPEDEHLDIDEALQAVTCTWKGRRTQPPQIIAFECNESWEFDPALGDDPHVLENLMKMPGPRSACLRIIDKIIRERLKCHICLFIGNKDAYAEPLNEWQLQSLGNWTNRDFYGDDYKFTYWMKFEDFLDLLDDDQRRIFSIASSFTDLLDSKGKEHWDPNGAYKKKLLALYQPKSWNSEEYRACENAASPRTLVDRYICERIQTLNLG
ncbi:small S protein [Colletotrichum kahawae]|uniref:Small S protein n=1 Tax=Colletotrichum kahawae TaxID=34407 RepID=A0AAD9YE94_COLKA|nr:small S protein [Colletotrichum kahawae]